MKDRQAPAAIPPVVIAAITYLPVQTGYFLERLEIIQTCLLSMRQNAGMSTAVMVWDNGSCAKLRDWLRDVYKPDWLMLSPNIGKTEARQCLLRMFPPETILALTDDDMLFYPGWLQPQLDLLAKWPNVGAVTGYPCRAMMKHGNQKTLQWARENATLRVGQFLSREWEVEYAESVEIPPAAWLGRINQEVDYLIEYNRMEAYGTSHHCQFIGYAGRLTPLIRRATQALASEHQSDADIDNAGLLRLATTERLCKHMGNRWDTKLRMDVEAMELA